MMPAVDMVGRRCGRLTVVERAESRKRRVYWRCHCDCGGAIDASGHNLRLGRVKSCGCLVVEGQHGKARRKKKTSEYLTWVTLNQRCANPKNDSYRDYGGRGITVCERWQDFANFIADMGERPSPKHSIDRINNDGNYEPDNCRWATMKEQTSHTRRNIIVSVRGETMTLMQAVERYGGRYGRALARIHRGWSAERALEISA